MVAIPREKSSEDTGVLDPEEGRALFARQAERLLGISAEEFFRRWDAGEYRNLDDANELSKVMHLAVLIPFGRQDP